MLDKTDKNKIIAINTLIVYFRLFVITIIGLLTSRYVLQVLGVSDFGLYNVVGGIIAMFGFISGALSSSTVRFMNYELGKADGEPNYVFNICNTLHIIAALLILILAESIGIYYINNVLNVECGKESDAMFVFQISTIVACIGIISVPYQSLFTVHEKFITIALIEICSSILKLLIVLLLIFYTGNVLKLYAIGMSLLTFIPFLIYYYLCKHKWPTIVRPKIVRQWNAYKPVLVFNNYTVVGTLSIISRTEGANMLINYFFGTSVNAACAIGNTVANYVNTFVGNFDSASAPQITQNVSAGNTDRSLYLVNYTCRICVLLMIVIYFPFVSNLDFILHLWLGENVPEGALEFCHLTLLTAIVAATSGGVAQLVNSIGDIKWFKIWQCVLYMVCLPIGYWAYSAGYPAYFIIILFVISDILYRIIQLSLLCKYIKFDIKIFIRESYLRPLVIFVLLFVLSFFYKQVELTTFFFNILGLTISFIVTLIVVFILGLKSNEKALLIKFVSQHLLNK